jgi:ABC-type branched-subunit amino acid transport system ATPase component/ABC-type branched-subunit amino acid transport system permease subunit
MQLPIFAYSGPKHWALFVLAALALALLPIFFNDPFFILVMQSLGYLFIATLGLDILVGWTGQISLGHAGLFAIGAYTSALASTRLGLPFWLSAPLGVTIAGLFGSALAIPSLRARGPYLAMVTIAFGFMVEVTSNRWSFTGGPMGIMSIPAPTLPDGSEMTPTQYFWLIAGVALLCQLLAANMFRARLGRTLLALQGSEIAAQSLGINVYRYKVLAFVVSSVYAGIGGVFFAHQNGFINSDTFVFSLSVSFLTSALMGGSGTLFGPLVGSVILNLIPTVFAGLQEYQLYIYGGIILVTIVFLPKGIVGSLRQMPILQARRRPHAAIVSDLSVLDFSRNIVNDEPVLAVHGLAKNFGGVRALSGVDMTIRRGSVHGLIGPNGSGKSTFINVVTGVFRPSAGKITLFGKQDLSLLTPHHVAACGIIRTFQNLRLFGELSVIDNVMVGFHLQLKCGFFAQLLQTPAAVAEEVSFRRKALALLEFLSIAERANDQAKNLSYGQQRRLEIGRALAARPQLLMLDEPAAGLNPTELHGLARIIGDIKSAGVTLLVIEHHMDLIMGISDVISVFDFGQKIAEGSSVAVRQNDKVIEAYLGVAESHEVVVDA